MTILPEMAIKAFLVLAAAGGVSFMLRRRPAATRHLLWSLAVLTVLALPALLALAPRRTLDVAADNPLAGLAFTREPGGGDRGDIASGDRAGAMPRPGSQFGAEPSHGDETLTRPSAPGGDGQGTADPASAEVGPSQQQEDAPMTSVAGSDAGSGSTGSPAAATEALRHEDAPAGTTGAAVWSSLRPVAVGAWIAGVVVVLAALLLERVRLARIAGASDPCRGGRVASAFEQICRQTAVRRRPCLLIGDEGLMPMTWGTIRPVVLLPAAALRWPARRIEAVLRHEIAHVRRRDDLLQLAATVMAALHWFDPLAWWALRRMRVEREHACDDAVLRAGALPSSYAEELLDIADAFRTPVAATLAAQSMARQSQLRDRLAAVLEESRDRRALTPRAVALSAVTTLALVLPLATLAVTATPVQRPVAEPEGVMSRDTTSRDSSEAPAGPATEPAGARSGVESRRRPAATPTSMVVGAAQQPVSECWSPGVEREMRSMSHSDDDLRILEWESSGCRAEIRLQGELLFNDELTAVTGVSPGGSFRLEIDEDGVERRLEIRAEADGTAAYTWLIDGREQPFDQAARRWFDALLPQIFRATGIAAEERTAAIFRAQGADGVFREIDLIPSNSSKGRYLIALSAQPGLQAGDLQRILRTTDGDIDSNSVRARVLGAIGTRYRDEILGGNLETAYWQTVRSLESSSTKARLLGSLVEGEPQASPMVTRVLEEAGSGIESNSTLANFLRRLHRRYPDIATGGPQATLFWQTVARIDSNSTTRSFLLDLGEGEPVDSSVLPIIFDVAQDRIDSNSTLADFLRAIESRYPDIGTSGPLADRFWSTVERIDSSSTLSDLLLDLAAGKDTDSAMLDRVLATADDRISSSSQRRQFIVSFAGQHREAAAGRLSDQVLGFARGIQSRSARERTLRVLAEMGIG